MSYFRLFSLPIFLSTETNVVTNLNPFNSGNVFVSLFLITCSVFLICTSGSKELTWVKLAKALKACAHVVAFTCFFFEKFSRFLVSQYKRLSQPTFSACLKDLDNICGYIWMFCNNWFYINNVWVFRSCCKIRNLFQLFYWFCVFLSYKWLVMFFSIYRIRYFFLLIYLQTIVDLFFCYFTE